jgi:hypothetical protein
MSKLPLPNKSVPFSVAGFQKLYEQVRQDPGAAKIVADEIDANPRAVLEQLFILSSSQSEALTKVSDEHLRNKAKTLVNDLRSQTPGQLKVNIQSTGTDASVQPSEAAFSCSFLKQ